MPGAVTPQQYDLAKCHELIAEQDELTDQLITERADLLDRMTELNSELEAIIEANKATIERLENV